MPLPAAVTMATFSADAIVFGSTLLSFQEALAS
jgi:hypothetical protein